MREWLPGRWFWGAFAVLVIVYALWPELDLHVHRLLYLEGEGFYWKGHPLARFIHASVPVIAWSIPCSVIGTWLWKRWKKTPFGLTGRQAAYLLLSFALGPGLLVNTALKDQWGRARPSQTAEFGGTKPYTSPLRPAAHCERNCSFVSGHASVGFWFVSLAMLYPRRRRSLAIGSVALGGIIGLGRMAEGGHFLGDVLFCALAVYFVAHVLHRAMFTSRSAE